MYTFALMHVITVLMMSLLVQASREAVPSSCTLTLATPTPTNAVCGQQGKIKHPQSIGSSKQTSQTLCRNACLGSTQCKTFSYAASTQKCVLYSDALVKNGFTSSASGVRYWSRNCYGQSCVCPASYPTSCSGACVDTNSDPTNCGSCGNVCTSNTCNNGTCCIEPATLSNGGFEDGQIAPWYVELTGTVINIAQTAAGQPCHSGTYCMNQTGTGQYDYGSGSVAMFDTVAGQNYVAAGFSRALSADNLQCYMRFLVYTGQDFVTIGQLDAYPDTATWLEISGSFNATGTTAYFYAEVGCEEGYVASHFFDDFSVTADPPICGGS